MKNISVYSGVVHSLQLNFKSDTARRHFSCSAFANVVAKYIVKEPNSCIKLKSLIVISSKISKNSGRIHVSWMQSKYP